MRDRDIDDARQRYLRRWREYGYDPRSLGWDKGCQAVRFTAVLEGLSEEDFRSVVDIGCGFGDFLGHLRSAGWKGRYLGIDIVPEFVAEASERHRRDRAARFECLDIQKSAVQRYDLAVAIGIFNHKLEEHDLYVESMVRAMWECSSRAVVCDFLSTSSDPGRRREDLNYMDPREALALASRLSRRFAVHHAYMPFEFQLKIWHDASFSQEAPVFPPYVHLARPSHSREE